jgi:hypothetical protein
MGDSSAMQKGEDRKVTAAHAKRENKKRESCRRPFSTEARLTECEREEGGGRGGGKLLRWRNKTIVMVGADDD